MCATHYGPLIGIDTQASMIAKTVIDEIRQATNGNYVLGNQRFQDEIAATLKRRVTSGKTGRPTTKDRTLAQMDLLR